MAERVRCRGAALRWRDIGNRTGPGGAHGGIAYSTAAASVGTTDVSMVAITDMPGRNR